MLGVQCNGPITDEGADGGAAAAICRFPADIPELTSIRALAALAVVVFHFWAEAGATSAGGRLLAAGGLGVDLFFVLSGLVLTHVYLRDWRAGTFGHGRFLWKRFARLYPVHLVTLLGFVALYAGARTTGLGGDFEGEDWAAFPIHLVGLQAWGLADGAAWNHPSWSISAEAFAYLLFPLWLAAALWLGARAFLLACVLVFLAAGMSMEATGIELTGLTHDFGILRIAVEFGLGVGLYLVLLRVPPARWHGAAAAACLVLAAGAAVAGLPEFLAVGLLAAMLGLLASAARRPEGRGLLRAPALVYLGHISYSTYMVHIAFVIVAETLIDRLGLEGAAEVAVIAAAFAGIYTASAILYAFVERPAQSLLLRLAGPRHDWSLAKSA